MNNKGLKKMVILVTIICVIFTIINVVYNYVWPIYLLYKMNTDLMEAKTIAIIGSADGPTTIFMASSQSSFLITVIFTLLSIVGIAYLIITKRKKRY